MSEAAFEEFLAEDFVRIGAPVLGRCLRLDGRSVYLSGATGFFGKSILSLLVHLRRMGASIRVTALSRSPAKFLDAHPWCRDLPWLDWHHGDAQDRWPGEGTYDYVLHAATNTAADAHVDKVRMFDQIVAGTRNALEFAATHGVRRVLLCGSGAQYGAIPEGLAYGIPESSLLACDATLPGSAYGEAKRVSEVLAALKGVLHGIEIVNARCFAFVGPGLPLDGHFAIGNFIRDAIDGVPIQLATRGEALRSYLYSADLAVWLLVMLLEAANGSAINVGSDCAVRILDLAKRVRDVANPHLEVRAGTASSAGERRFYLPCIARAKSHGLDVWTDLDQAIARTALWHRAAIRGVAHRHSA